MIDLLQDVFPDKPLQTLQQALDDANGDTQLASAILLNDTNPTTTLTDRELLTSIFPDTPHETLASLYNPSFTLDENVSNILQSENSSSPSVWQNTRNNINQVVQYTGVKDHFARKYLHQNGLNAVLAIISIINSFDYNYLQTKIASQHPGVTKSKSESSIYNKPNTSHIRGRVQTSNGFAYLNKKTNTTTTPRQDKRTTEVKNILNHPYVFNPLEYSKLLDIIQGDHNLRSVSPVFLKNSFVFFCGDIDKVLMVCLLVVENNNELQTYPSKEVGPFEKQLHPIDNSRKKLYLSHIVTTNAKIKSSPTRYKSPASTLSSPTTSNTDISNDLFDNGKIDFHGFLPNQVKNILQSSLPKWWDEEMLERELHSDKSGSLVKYVSPITIITGRGLHSVGGISKVRIQVQKFLEQNHYVYEEQPSLFIVQGKKIQR
ncbi:hypothetical protein TBLA_0I00290 [Henningerozyma blattae CBS 6284]|uniref:Smr domain-containing protein n=1 Tax=Henningerozyma blattae (strain ATCC 34711 / CBS 6284 / DSM 70876 / NBRC 10599 / NRRL Y-10934 / UCD 77-7) TaxID=1071380 RepID=I2H8J2_HENB6|nr:hypothetical protein TBLA_0I00290 [Tetrapisispora blattae CBS 6284]CCH62694.1 hypothetical protein TBLA_0I00290 [Tetrapisispora blattae CBS 6284]